MQNIIYFLKDSFSLIKKGVQLLKKYYKAHSTILSTGLIASADYLRRRTVLALRAPYTALNGERKRAVILFTKRMRRQYINLNERMRVKLKQGDLSPL